MAFGLSRFRLSQVLTHIGHMAQGMVLLDVKEHEPVRPFRVMITGYVRAESLYSPKFRTSPDAVSRFMFGFPVLGTLTMAS